MIRLAISVEGQTEKEFFTRVIASHLSHFGISATPIIVTTKRILDGSNQQGGDVSIARILREVKPLIYSFDFVTTFYDLYAFKGRRETDTAEILCDSIKKELNSPKNFIPYIQRYEFESLLFSDCETVGRYFKSDAIGGELFEAVQKKSNAEEVNDSYHTCPSRRIANACKSHTNGKYDKVFHGPSIAEKIGIEKIRQACPSFSAWLGSLEALKK